MKEQLRLGALHWRGHCRANTGGGLSQRPSADKHIFVRVMSRGVIRLWFPFPPSEPAIECEIY